MDNFFKVTHRLTSSFKKKRITARFRLFLGFLSVDGSSFNGGDPLAGGQPFMLDALERPYALVWGAVQGTARHCFPDDRGRLAPLAGEGRGGVVRGGVLLTPPGGSYVILFLMSFRRSNIYI